LAEYKNPNQHGGKQDSHTMLIFTMVFLAILLGFQIFRPKTPSKQTAPTKATQEAKTESAAPPSSAGSQSAPAQGAAASQTSKAPAAPAAAPAKVPAAPKVAAAQAETTVVENDLYKITFTNKGGHVTSWILKKYTNREGKPLDLVNPLGAEKVGDPLSLYTADAGLRKELNEALYVPSSTGSVKAPGELSYEYSANGLTVHKTFKFDSSYIVHATVSVTKDGKPVEALLSWPAGFGDQRVERDYSSEQKLDRSVGGKAESTAADKTADGQKYSGQLDWGGVSDLYFAAIFLPDHPNASTLVSLSNKVNVPEDPSKPNGETKPQPILGAAVGAADGPTSVRFFAGPKALRLLQSIHATGADGKPNGPNLSPLVHYGLFSIVAKPLFYVLAWVHAHIVPNWGWAILLLTLAITMATFPTRFATMKSSVKMQRIQPQLNAIKEKYKKFKFDDPRKQDMHKEMQGLYKTEGVNMFGSCLPMLIQLPLIWAFYEMLENAIELRNAHWYWLHDLSSADPYHILPFVLVASQFLVQFFTPSPGMDASQQKMMAFSMPLVSGFIAWHYASGLALYWAGSNVIGIGQQYVINKTKLGKEMREIQLKRAMKKKGARQTAVARR
jgi:YidC/Oxa1 family membrane protein insertase